MKTTQWSIRLDEAEIVYLQVAYHILYFISSLFKSWHQEFFVSEAATNSWKVVYVIKIILTHIHTNIYPNNDQY